MCQASECHRLNFCFRHMPGFREEENEKIINNDAFDGGFPNG